MIALVVYSLLWFSFGVLHSWLAGESARQRYEPALGQRYRLVYNVVATVHTIAVLLIGSWLFRDFAPFDLPFEVDALRLLSLVVGTVVLFLSLGQYDLGAFSGLKQLGMSESDITDDVGHQQEIEPLQTSGIHRVVRHPLYSALFLLLWGIADSMFGLVTAVLASLYLLLGTYSEERKLIALYGKSYEEYRQRVPAFIPWKVLLSR